MVESVMIPSSQLGYMQYNFYDIIELITLSHVDSPSRDRFVTRVSDCRRPNESKIAALSIAILYLHLAECDYGVKVSTNSTDTPSFTDEYEDISEEILHTTTTEDDGVVIEKAILAAEITPKASYYLVEPPSRGSQKYSDTLDTLHDDDQEYLNRDGSDSSQSSVGESVRHTFSKTNKKTKSNSVANVQSSRVSKGSRNIKRVQNNDDAHLDSLDLSQTTSTPTNSAYQKTYSSTYRNPTNFEIIPAEIIEVNSNDFETSPIGSFDSNMNEMSYHQGSDNTNHQESNQSNPSTPMFLIRVEEPNQQMEEDRLSQIEATKSYIQEAKAAQKYAAKIQALQNEVIKSLQVSKSNPTSWPGNGDTRSYTPSDTSVNVHSVYPAVGTTSQDVFSSNSQTEQVDHLSWSANGYSHSYSQPDTQLNAQSFSSSTIGRAVPEDLFTSSPAETNPSSGWSTNGDSRSYLQPAISLNSQHSVSPSVSNTAQGESSTSLQTFKTNPLTSSISEDTGSYLSSGTSHNSQSTISTTVGRAEAPGLGNIGFYNGHQEIPSYSSQTYPSHSSQDISATGSGWSSTSSQVGGFSQPIFYMGPLAFPVVLSSGFLADTEEVRLAKIAHLKALMNALQTAPHWKTNVPMHWN
ncbi:hypothetical protein J6590_000933 [Homalodisca vitripennis]|nr:hypothetical protein J6590_000933 [Homalodisca vitripennis]